MKNFLKEINIIRKEYKMLTDREEKFNIFSALHKDHDERRLHSRFISVMLQPDGTHGMGSVFFNLFLETLKDISNTQNIKNQNFDFKQTLVYPTESDKKEKNEIDILIIDRSNKSAIIIENKIYAGDSNHEDRGQLEGYIKHIVKNEKIPLEKLFTIYLTLDEHSPSDDSIREFKDNTELWKAISYPELITVWLEKCLMQVSDKPFLRESIIQYIKLIKKMTGDISIEERLKYKAEIASSPDNMKSAKVLIDNFKHIKWHSVHEFWVKLSDRINENYSITKNINDDKDNPIRELTHRNYKSKKQKISVNFKLNSGIIITVRFSTTNNNFYFGISKDGNKDLDICDKIEEIALEDNKYTSNGWMCIYKVFDKNIKFDDFSQDLTFSLISSENQDKLIDETWSEIMELVKIIENKFND